MQNSNCISYWDIKDFVENVQKVCFANNFNDFILKLKEACKQTIFTINTSLPQSRTSVMKCFTKPKFISFLKIIQNICSEELDYTNFVKKLSEICDQYYYNFDYLSGKLPTFIFDIIGACEQKTYSDFVKILFIVCNKQIIQFKKESMQKSIEELQHEEEYKQKLQTEEPTGLQTEEPTGLQTEEPTGLQTEEPTGLQTEEPTGLQTEEPTGLQDNILFLEKQFITIVDAILKNKLKATDQTDFEIFKSMLQKECIYIYEKINPDTLNSEVNDLRWFLMGLSHICNSDNIKFYILFKRKLSTLCRDYYNKSNNKNSTLLKFILDIITACEEQTYDKFKKHLQLKTTEKLKLIGGINTKKRTQNKRIIKIKKRTQNKRIIKIKKRTQNKRIIKIKKRTQNKRIINKNVF